jgi:Mg-chelatase subunit ChlD
MEEYGATNIWAGLSTAIDILLEQSKDISRHKSIILLTDGEPNRVPPEGH